MGSVSPLHPAILPQWLRTSIPSGLKPAVRDTICTLVDTIDGILRTPDPLIPPARLRVRVGCFASYIRIGKYLDVAREFASHLVKIAQLTPNTRMLDIGCGCGQMAAAVARLIGRDGAYHGFDLDEEAIAWCRSQISSRFPQFRFDHADVVNTLYNPSGHVRADEFCFPYPDRSFDIILLKSVFTHMPHHSMARYLREIGRMLRPDGRCLASFYLLNEEARDHITNGKSAYTFPYAEEGYSVVERSTPDYVVAQDETSMRAVASQAGLQVCSPVHYGAWCGRTNYVSFQDLVLFTRDHNEPIVD